uniref:Uncharacterized protein n=1 Tax=Lepeophtheirus salmonis TaxID=72036 RepID=A0A0K2V6W7_LEPSM
MIFFLKRKQRRKKIRRRDERKKNPKCPSNLHEDPLIISVLGRLYKKRGMWNGL